MKYREEYISALRKEMLMRKEYIKGETIETIYFGGGTPSQLSKEDFEKIFETIYNTFTVTTNSEITLEANPDDLTMEYLKDISGLPFNRISMGIQSFDDRDLEFLNRRHTTLQAKEAVGSCRSIGIENISIDLIYGLPGQTLSAWGKNIEEAIRLDVPHISAYHLTYEEGTGLYRLKENGKIIPTEEEVSIQQFSLLIDKLTEKGYIHYEISNFCKESSISRHNSSYWQRKSYLGLGPSAHSYNGENRQWNVSSLPLYLNGILENTPVFETEHLDNRTCYNDYVLTGLRTIWGIDLTFIKENFGENYSNYCLNNSLLHIDQNLMIQSGNILTITRQGLFISDSIISDLLYI